MAKLGLPPPLTHQQDSPLTLTSCEWAGWVGGQRLGASITPACSALVLQLWPLGSPSTPFSATGPSLQANPGLNILPSVLLYCFPLSQDHPHPPGQPQSPHSASLLHSLNSVQALVPETY